MAAPAFNAKQVQSDLIQLGFLPKGGDDGKWGKGSTHALTRFQRRAATIYRLSAATGLPADCAPGELFKGKDTGDVDEATLNEIKKWQDKKWKAPLGRFKWKSIGTGILREDAADQWIKLVTRIKGLGGTIDGPYGDTRRGIGKAKKVGASSYSYHIVGRAVDINQALNGPPNQRYYITKDQQSDGMYWRIYCKTDSQDGSQGTKYDKGGLDCWSFYEKKEFKLPAGSYIDLTAEIARAGFDRIRAQTGWESTYNRSEWWHFQYNADQQRTFEDECELVGISAKDLKAAGYGDADLDHKPG